MGFDPWKARGDWALVTGASSGIGREFCRQLAAIGMNLVLVARRQKRLEELAAELQERNQVSTRVLPMDLSMRGAGPKLKHAVEKEGLRIRLLCNNAGFGPWGRFENSSSQNYEDLLCLMANTTVGACREFFPDLASFSSSAVINLSSPAAYQPLCYKAVYAAAKACVHNFSLALHQEWKDLGIVVQTLVPGATRSELEAAGGQYDCGIRFKFRDPSHVVQRSLGALPRGMPLVTTAEGTYSQRAFFGLFPTRLVLRKVERIFRPPEGHPAGKRLGLRIKCV